MALVLPNFAGSKCGLITVCARIHGVGVSKFEHLEGKKFLTSSRTSKGAKVFLRILGGGKDRDHLHVDVATASYFGKQTPKDTNKISDLEKFIAHFEGEEIDAGIRGVFKVEIEALPSDGVIRSLMVERKYARMSMRMSGSTITIEGAPIRQVKWESLDDKKHVEVEIWGHQKIMIDKQYLEDARQWIESFFESFVLGKVTS